MPTRLLNPSGPVPLRPHTPPKRRIRPTPRILLPRLRHASRRQSRFLRYPTVRLGAFGRASALRLSNAGSFLDCDCGVGRNAGGSRAEGRATSLYGSALRHSTLKPVHQPDPWILGRILWGFCRSLQRFRGSISTSRTWLPSCLPTGGPQVEGDCKL